MTSSTPGYESPRQPLSPLCAPQDLRPCCDGPRHACCQQSIRLCVNLTPPICSRKLLSSAWSPKTLLLTPESSSPGSVGKHPGGKGWGGADKGVPARCVALSPAAPITLF
jgi:hypothetical protein